MGAAASCSAGSTVPRSWRCSARPARPEAEELARRFAALQLRLNTVTVSGLPDLVPRLRGEIEASVTDVPLRTELLGLLGRARRRWPRRLPLRLPSPQCAGRTGRLGRHRLDHGRGRAAGGRPGPHARPPRTVVDRAIGDLCACRAPDRPGGPRARATTPSTPGSASWRRRASPRVFAAQRRRGSCGWLAGRARSSADRRSVPGRRDLPGSADWIDRSFTRGNERSFGGTEGNPAQAAVFRAAPGRGGGGTPAPWPGSPARPGRRCLAA